MTHRLAFTLCRVAGHMLPAARKPWADAMTAELAHAEDDRAALAYAGGCLLAALHERMCDFDTRFTAGLWSIAIVTSLFAVVQFACAAHGIRALLGARDGMSEALLHHGASPALMASYEAARPIVIGCFIILGCTHLAAAWFLSRTQFHRFLIAWCAALLVASVAVAIQLSIVWSIDGVPSEFHALILQAVVLPALLAWSQSRHKYSGRI
ncbi:hypothetical protein [Sphingomonas alpina]|uniref:Uncharacterized protein n=1 Tax=Sphingomonas alpina TaxID=653931 RepID=A0A7H0LEE9_9SPHN|nr:hypothetical protein [Sphingomonas alpina]QNQ08052.1 hypothetical protein H3Z74_14835 [Sphingomonas alpina]